MKDLFLVTPPFTQLNTPYPATAYLKGFLNEKNRSSFQMDLGIEVILEIFSKEGLSEIFEIAFQKEQIISENASRIYALREHYLLAINDVVSFLQGKNQTLARQICTENFLPQASRFNQVEDLEWAFGLMGMQDKAKHLATLFLEDLSDFITECIDENFGFSRYAERLGRSASTFDQLQGHLQEELSYIDELSIKILAKQVNIQNPKLVCFSVPFPGNLYSAFRCAQFIKKEYPAIKIVMGGGFPNTELRSLTDPRVFDFVDYITLDDGELPLELLANHVLNPVNETPALKRTFERINGKVKYNNSSPIQDYKQHELGTPDYSDLLLDKYISVIEIANPMHSLWSDGRWNKLTMAHGCYWGKCTFCDGSLNYIKSFEPIAAKVLADRIEKIVAQTGEKGFHFVDEAAPPALMKALAIEIIKRKLNITWWTNVRFEKSFTKDLCLLLKASGCIAVSGGLEVASDRLLKLINKGVTLKQVAQVTNNFTETGIMVHAYLMYGFPSQTVQETIDSLEVVRQIFELGIVQSAFWHQFALTAHSPVGLNPSAYGITPEYKAISFANNDIQFTDKTGIDHDLFSYGLKKSLYNYMHGLGFEIPLQDWFDDVPSGFRIPKTSIRQDFIQNCLEAVEYITPKDSAKPIWLGGVPEIVTITKSKKGRSWKLSKMCFHEKTESFEISLEKEKGDWLLDVLKKISVKEENTLSLAALKADFENHFEDFELFWYSKPMNQLREHSLLIL
ncbi:radical SAM protein [Labilibaculum sp. A4]|uniref:B12-binding domain-containing radical SAM protein n=1 Tax=Labilibaculum euxinus TaxID=2686357 RepID=UPI000F61F3D1|nr:radical SAM protein [Labilibaculum euxinus]MDQ1772497.1 radical SAM protein [Labilibaculum euxinus]MWN78218.1 radical SAM protein [Labilibaculum euxinus]